VLFAYVLYGSYASYATTEPHRELRKKGVPFFERLPASNRFREFSRSFEPQGTDEDLDHYGAEKRTFSA